MIDAATHEPIHVETHENAGSRIRVSLHHLEHLRKLLVDNQIPHWVDHHALSIDGAPAMVMIYLRQKADPRQVRALLDQAVGGTGPCLPWRTCGRSRSGRTAS